MPRRSAIEDDEGWTEGAENTLLTWAEKAAGLRWLHVEAGKLQGLLNDVVSVPVVILSTLAGLGSLVDNGCSRTWVSIAFTVINLLNAALVSLQRYMEPGQKASTHKAIANDYSKLYRTIAQEVSLPVRRRENCIEFVTACRTEYDRLVGSSLEVPSLVVRRFKRRFASTNQAQPEVISGGLEQIHRNHQAPHLTQNMQEVADGPMDVAARGGAVTAAPGLAPAGSRKMRRASTVINDVLTNPGIRPEVYRSQRLPDLPERPDSVERIEPQHMVLTMEELRERGIEEPIL